MNIGLETLKKSYLRLIRSAVKFKDDNYKDYFINKSRRMYRDAIRNNTNLEDLLLNSSQLEGVLLRQATIFNQYNDCEIKIDK